MTKTPVVDLLPFQNSGEPCNEQGGCFVAGDTRVNENTALAAMHTVWVRLHNYYAEFTGDFSRPEPGTFPTLRLDNPERNIIIFEEARKMVIALFSMTSRFLEMLMSLPTKAIIQLYNQTLSKPLLRCIPIWSYVGS